MTIKTECDKILPEKEGKEVMNKYYFEGKTEEQAINLALYELNISEEDLIVNNVEDKSSLLKKNVKIEVLNIKEIVSFIKDTLSKMTELMGAKSNFEVKRRENSITVTIFSENNAILIGKNGKNVAALQLLIRQMVNSKLKEPLSIITDVGTDTVSIGNTVSIKYVDDDEEDEYKIVGSQEADPFESKISNESPIAQALFDHKVGDIVTVESPNGNYEVEIIEIK